MRLEIVLALLALMPSAPTAATPRQVQVHQNGAHVMPFSMDSSMHMFEQTPDGGVMTVHTHDGDPRQIELIRAHLRKEAAAFSAGDYRDPIAIHGKAMPGVAELSAGASRVTVRYASTSDGGRIALTSASPRLVRAIHRWFDAQLADHGSDAMPM